MREELTRSPVHKIIMAENSELKNRLTNWLLEEAITVTQLPDDNAEFRLQVTFGYVIDVVKPKGIPHLVSTARLSYSDENSQKTISKLSRKKKVELGFELQNELTKFPIGYVLNPNVENFESVDFHHTIYLEDLTKTAFIGSVDIVRRSMVCFTGVFNNRLDIQIDEPKTSDNKAGVA